VKFASKFFCTLTLLSSNLLFEQVLASDLKIARPDTNTDAKLPIKYLGNCFSGKFHRPSCKFGKAISASHVALFNFRWQAVQSGQVPCRYCLPPTWTSVKAVILSNPLINKESHPNQNSTQQSHKAPQTVSQSSSCDIRESSR
jgi:hypothetical protein